RHRRLPQGRDAPLRGRGAIGRAVARPPQRQLPRAPRAGLLRVVAALQRRSAGGVLMSYELRITNWKRAWWCAGVFFAACGTVRGNDPVDSLVARAMAEGYWSARVDSSAADGWARGPQYRLRRVEARDEAGRPVDGFAGEEWAGEP